MTEKGGFQGTYTSCFERAVTAALKQTYTAVHVDCFMSIAR